MPRLNGSQQHPLTIVLNDVEVTGYAAPRILLSDFLRHRLGASGTHVGCEQGVCGACTVHLDGVPVRSCQTFVEDAVDSEITTIEGIGDKVAETIQQVWADFDVPQCGYCQSGQIMSAVALLVETPKPTDEDIDDAMAGNLCRCATYQRIRGAIHEAAKRLEG